MFQSLELTRDIQKANEMIEKRENSIKLQSLKSTEHKRQDKHLNSFKYRLEQHRKGLEIQKTRYQKPQHTYIYQTLDLGGEKRDQGDNLIIEDRLDCRSMSTGELPGLSHNHSKAQIIQPEPADLVEISDHEPSNISVIAKEKKKKFKRVQPIVETKKSIFHDDDDDAQERELKLRMDSMKPYNDFVKAIEDSKTHMKQ